MPLRQLDRSANPNAEYLRTLLEKEWREPNELATQPLIIEEVGSRYNVSKHIYVIWDNWQPLGQTDRSEIIMDAYAGTHTPEETLNVTVAMGLTPDEARKMGVPD